jgi:hypothetical protein
MSEPLTTDEHLAHLRRIDIIIGTILGLPILVYVTYGVLNAVGIAKGFKIL